MKEKYQYKTLEELADEIKHESYIELFKKVNDLVDKGVLVPVKSSLTNGRREALYNKYRRKIHSYNESEIKKELFSLIKIPDVSYYQKNMQSYINEKEYVFMLDNFLVNHSELLETKVSENERSFQIWGKEKFLHGNDKDKGVKGKTILNHCGMKPSELNIYETNTPLAYYSASTNSPQNILILENCDPYYGMRQHLINGNKTILGKEIGTVIYGAGKGVAKSIRDLENCCSSYLSDENNKYFYYGDLDYEGIQIFVDLKHDMAVDLDGKFELVPFKEAYITMLNESKKIKKLPLTKKGQKESDRDIEFFEYFEEEQVSDMKKILKDRQYIPQEILNVSKY